MDNSLIKMNVAFKSLFKKQRYKVYYGGRGGGKSRAFAQALVILGVQNTLRILCTRESQISIKDSVHKLLKDTITLFELDTFYRVTREGIYGGNGTEFIFKGLRHSPQTIKSLEGVDLCWVEEAQTISTESWDVLIPTIRKNDSEIWLSLNPNLETDPTYTKFLTPPIRKNQITVKVNYDDNAFFPDVLRKEMEYQKRINHSDYLHIWEGECKTSTEAQIFKNKYVVEDFESPTDDTVFYYGLDWGFSQSPLAINRCFIKIIDGLKHLFIDYEAAGVGVELDDTGQLIDTIPGSKNNEIRADSSRPESISHVNRQGYNIKSVYKWHGSVEDGIEHIKSYKCVHVHTRCMKTASEFLMYSYKVDKLTGNILTTIIDANNHHIDDIRYALQPIIKQKPQLMTMRLRGA